jgi:hypothetical protein
MIFLMCSWKCGEMVIFEINWAILDSMLR